LQGQPEHTLLGVKAHADAALTPARGGASRLGLSVTTGTLNERALLDRIVALRPDAVTSDRPHARHEVLTAAPLLAA
jgi:hypothetical protein